MSKAIEQISSLRGRLGAFQSNTVGSTIRSLGVSVENTTAAESTIRDADFAAETAWIDPVADSRERVDAGAGPGQPAPQAAQSSAKQKPEKAPVRKRCQTPTPAAAFSLVPRTARSQRRTQAQTDA